MGEIVKGLERALLTRPVPTKDAAVRFLLKAEKGSTKNVSVLLGISQRTVQRWVTTRPGVRRRPSAVHAGLIDEAVMARWQPLVRARLRARAESDGFVLHTRARFGFAAPAVGPALVGCRAFQSKQVRSVPRGWYRSVFRQPTRRSSRRSRTAGSCPARYRLIDRENLVSGRDLPLGAPGARAGCLPPGRAGPLT